MEKTSYTFKQYGKFFNKWSNLHQNKRIPTEEKPYKYKGHSSLSPVLKHQKIHKEQKFYNIMTIKRTLLKHEV
jgi:hypothetical protein